MLLTSTLSVFRVADALLSYLHELPGNAETPSLNPVVAETNDGYPVRHLGPAASPTCTSPAALDGAAGGPVAEGCVGRRHRHRGARVQGRYRHLLQDLPGELRPGHARRARAGQLRRPADGRSACRARRRPIRRSRHGEPDGNSCVIVLATDAQLDSRQLTRLASRAFAGMARTGSDFSGHSGDYALAISTAAAATRERGRSPVPDQDLDLFFLAAIEATEEAILNSPVHGGDHHGIPRSCPRGGAAGLRPASASPADQTASVGPDPEQAVRPEWHRAVTAATNRPDRPCSGPGACWRCSRRPAPGRQQQLAHELVPLHRAELPGEQPSAGVQGHPQVSPVLAG